MAGYGSDEAFQTWATENGHTVPTGTVAAARQRGSVYVDGTYGHRFPGEPTGGVEQERAWPRTGAADRYGNAIPSETVPTRVEHAAYEAALIELQTPGALAPVIVASEQVKREKVGPLEVEYAGAADPVAAATPIVKAIEHILAPLLVPADFPAVLVV